MVRLFVRNWRCVEELEIALEPVTILIGRNSTGKSSLAYAPYFLTKVVEWKDANKVLTQLYGVTLDGVVRRYGNQKFYPIVIEAEGSRFEARNASNFDVPKTTPWVNSYLLPSQRLSFLKISQFIPKLRHEIVVKYPEAKALLAFASSIFELVKTMPLLPPLYLFIEDFMKLYLGKGFSGRYELSDMGTLVEEVTPLLSLIAFKYVDPFAKLELPSDLAPDGFIDATLAKLFVDRASEESLVVIEEPEIYKNPVLIVDLVKYLAKRAVEKRLTLVITTHNDVVLQALAKAVEERIIKPRQVAIYYLERSRGNPWTRARKLEMYEDGTIEELPDVEKVVSMLF